MVLPRFLALLVSAAVLSGCSGVSLRPAVQATSLDYATVFEEFNNQGVLRNILRASDHAPLSFADLPILHGSLSMQSTLGLSVPFGAFHAANGRNSLTAGLQFTSSPTFDTSPLNTSGFSLNLLQPISPTFVVAAWQSGVSKEVLLRLFVESIEFGKCGRKFRLNNDPLGGALVAQVKARGCGGERTDVTTFAQLIDRAIAADLDLRIFTVLQPLGRPDADASKIKGIIDAASAAEPGGLHVGNKDSSGRLQVYRTTSSLVLGCLDVAAFNSAAAPMFNMPLPSSFKGPDERPSATRAGAAPRATGSGTRTIPLRAPPPVAGMGGGNEGPGGPADFVREQSRIIGPAFKAETVSGMMPATPTAAPSGGGAAKSAPPQQQSGVQSGRLSSLVDQRYCRENPLTLDYVEPQAEDSRESERSIVIHWRSIASVFRYLGAIVAEQGRTLGGGNGDPWTWTGSGGREVLFDLSDDPRSVRVTTTYRGKAYGVSGQGHGDVVVDHSLTVMALLTELLNDTRVAGDIPTTQRLEVVP